MLRSLQALEAFKKDQGHSPRPWNTSDANLFVSLVEKFHGEALDESQKEFATKVSFL